MVIKLLNLKGKKTFHHILPRLFHIINEAFEHLYGVVPIRENSN